MTEHKSVYYFSAADAQLRKELDLWRESHKENCKCARAIEDAIRQGFDGWYLKEDCAANVIKQFGFERVYFVLANTIREKSWDGRFSKSNKEWSRTFDISQNDRNEAFLVGSHPAVLDGFVDLVRHTWPNLDTESHAEEPTQYDDLGQTM